MRIVQESRRVIHTNYQLFFNRKGYVDWGFAFDCDKNGKTHLFPMSDLAQFNYLSCLLGNVDGSEVEDKGISSWKVDYKQPAIGLCRCGTQVYLEGFTNTCENCNTDYNWAGQELAPRECWGEETGEYWADCFNPQMED